MATGFSPKAFNAHIHSVGVCSQWQRANECPCRLDRTGGSDTDCVVCNGNRYLWDAPIPVTIGLQGLEGNRKWAAFGEWQAGDALATIPSDSPAYGCGEYDRFVVSEAEYRWNIVLKKTLDDQLKHGRIKKIERVWAIVNNSAVDFEEFDHWELKDRTLQWVDGVSLPDGQQYSIRYLASPEYFVFTGLVQDRPQYNRDLPRKVPLRLMDLFFQSIS